MLKPLLVRITKYLTAMALLLIMFPAMAMAADSEAPVFDYASATVSPLEATVGDTVVISVPITDDVGVASATICVKNTGTGDTLNLSGAYSESSGLWEFGLPVTDDTPNGTWGVIYYTAKDAAGNMDNAYQYFCTFKVYEIDDPDQGHVINTPIIENNVDPTCAESGSYDEVTYCSFCGCEVYRVTHVIEALGHDWGEGEVTKDPTCTEAGTRTFTCSHDTSHVRTEDIAALGHDWSDEYEADEPAACTEAGSESIHCTRCGESQEGTSREVPATGHSWGDWEVTTEPTCTHAGTRERKCSECGEAESETIPALGHSFTSYASDGNATCEADGTKTAACDNGCGETDTVADEGSALGHDWGEGEVTKEPTCTEAGVRTFTCSHDASHTRTEAVPALGHDWSDDYAADVPATCTAAGYESIHCTRCGGSKEGTSREVPATGHSWGEWATTTEPTYDSEGERMRSCTSCGIEDRGAIPMLVRTDISEAIVSVADCTYTGESIIPVISVTIDDVQLVDGEDFDATFDDNTNAGTAHVTITGKGGYEGTIGVDFNINKAEQYITASNLNLTATRSSKLVAEASDGGALTYKSSNTSIATVAADGTVKAISVGTATITITAAETDNFLQATKDVIVTVARATATIAASSKTVQVKKTVKLGASTTGNGKLTYKSSNTKIATVTATGVVKGVKAGKVTITITAAQTSVYDKATKKVTVYVKNANPLVAKAKKSTVTASAKSLKSKAVTLASNVAVTKAKGTVTYANASTNATAKKFKVNAKSGKVTIPKGTKAGTYTVKVKVTAKGNTSYTPGIKTMTYKVKVK